MLSENVCIRFVSTVRNLGIKLDKFITFHDQVLTIKKKSFLTIRNLWKIRSLLSSDQLKTVCNSFTISCIDYCNSVYFGINKNDVRQLQITQNMAARVVTGKRKYDHMDDDLKNLHWLSIEKRIIFKLCLLVFKSLMGLSPEYIQEMVSYKSTGQRTDLNVPHHNSSYGKRAFSVAAPKIWNKLPRVVKESGNVKDFKRKLKTFLFSLSSEYVFKLWDL